MKSAISLCFQCSSIYNLLKRNVRSHLLHFQVLYALPCIQCYCIYKQQYEKHLCNKFHTTNIIVKSSLCMITLSGITTLIIGKKQLERKGRQRLVNDACIHGCCLLSKGIGEMMCRTLSFSFMPCEVLVGRRYLASEQIITTYL